MLRSSFIKLVSNHLKASFSTTAEAPVLFEYNKKVCKVILNKPKALNALDLEMIRILKPEVEQWSTNNDARVVLFTGAGGKAFCAGGDIKSLYEAKQSGATSEIHDTFFREEYTLDLALANMRPIQVAFWDGIVMGGGVGISVHSPIKIATEHAMFAMPEARIGLFTDVAGGYFLSRLRSNLGYFLGLTGTRLKGQELVQTGLADYYVKREQLGNLEKEIVEKTTRETRVEDLRTIVQKYQEPVEKKYTNEEFINKAFGQESVEKIYEALKNAPADNKEFAAKLITAMDAQSPLSMKIIHEQIKRGKDLDLRENFQMDMRLVLRFMEGNDFFEGVRCTLVDKNDKPKWQYSSLKEVPQQEIDSYFDKLTSQQELQYSH